MYFASSISKRLVLVPIFVVVATQLLLMCSVSSLNMTNEYLHHKCLSNYGKYKPGSEHEKNLNLLIRGFSESRDVFRNGYGMMGLGHQPDKVIVTLQCRGDSYGSKCRSCFDTAQSELSQRCPRIKGGIIWYDQCLVEFSSIDTYGKINYDDGLCIASTKNTSTSDNLILKWLALIHNLTRIVVTKTKIGYYAAGEKRFQNMKMYAMVQCIKDLSVKDCGECVNYNMLHSFKCFENKQGARVFLGRSCNFRFELYPFVNPKTSPNYFKF